MVSFAVLMNCGSPMAFRILCWLLYPFARILSPLCHWLPAPPFRGIDRANPRASRFLRESIGDGARLLMVGGVRGTDTEYFLPYFQPLLVDLFPVPGVHVRCDVHWLPFQDGTLDGAVVQGVIDYVDHPSLMVRELYRTIRPGGGLYTNDSFLQIHQPNPVDLQRFTREGWEKLLHEFDIHEMGASVGPLGAIYMMIMELIKRAIPNPHTRFVTWFFWGHFHRFLFWMDGRIVQKSWAMDGAAAIYTLALRPGKT